MKISEKIKELRIEKGISQKSLGEAIGVSQKAIDYWEREVNEPKIGYILKLIAFFEVSPNEFFEDIEIRI